MVAKNILNPEMLIQNLNLHPIRIEFSTDNSKAVFKPTLSSFIGKILSGGSNLGLN